MDFMIVKQDVAHGALAVPNRGPSGIGRKEKI
jgi:hypothetical protein